MRIFSSLFFAATLAASSGCRTAPKKTPPIKLEIEQSSTKVYDREQGGNQPPPNAIPSDVYGSEEYFAPNNGAQPVIHQPQVMIIGQTPQRDPRNPNVYRGGRVDYVVVRDWEWNENALRKGTDLQIPDPGQNAGIEELTVVEASPRTPPPPKLDGADPADASKLSPPTAPLIGTGTNETPAMLVSASTATTPPPKDAMELPAKTEPTVLDGFLKANGISHFGLRKNLRTLALPDKAQYDQATRMVGPDEELGWLPNYGWTAFQLKTSNDLTEDEKARWLKSPEYQAFLAGYESKRKAQAQIEAKLAEKSDLDGTRPTGGKPPVVIDVDLKQQAQDGSVKAESKP